MTARRASVLLLLSGLAIGCTPSPPGAALDFDAAQPLTADSGIPLELTVPLPGALVPFAFPSLDLAWRDGFRASHFRVRVLVNGAEVARSDTQERRWRLPLDAVKAAAGEGGAFEVEVRAGSFEPDGRVVLPPVFVRAAARFTAAGEHPGGAVVYGAKVRPAGAPPGPIDVDNRSVQIMRVDLADPRAEVLMERIPGIDDIRAAQDPGIRPPEWPASPRAAFSQDFSGRAPRQGMPAHAATDQRGERNCLSCHTVSSDGRYLAVNSQEDEVVPAGWDSSQGVMHVFERPARRAPREWKKVRVLPGGVFPRFHPHQPGRLLYSAAGGSFSVKQRVSIYRADLVVADVASSDPPRPIPGASDPKRCEVFGDWSPDGARVAFARSAEGEPCRGTRGKLDLWTVPVEGGTPEPVRGASNNGLSNAQPRWSPDGRWIVYFASDRGFFSRGTADLYIVPAQGGAARKLEVSTRSMESWHAFSPDGAWLAFVTNRERVDQPRIWLTRLDAKGHASPEVPLPGASGPNTHVHTMDWGP